MPEANNGFREFLHRLAIKTRQGLKKFMRAGLPYASVRYKGNVRRSFFEGACWVAFGSVRYKETDRFLPCRGILSRMKRPKPIGGNGGRQGRFLSC